MRNSNARLTRWSLQIQPYRMTIRLHSGPQNRNTDGLSHPPELVVEDEKQLHQPHSSYVCSVISSVAQLLSFFNKRRFFKRTLSAWLHYICPLCFSCQSSGKHTKSAIPKMLRRDDELNDCTFLGFCIVL